MARDEIPLVDLVRQHSDLRAEIDTAISGVLASSDFILGREVEEFEAEFAAYCESPHAVGLDSGISALELGMRALGIGPGDEVITPANSFIASSSAVSFVGATPIWIDVDPQTHNLDPALLEASLTPRTKAVMPVHLYGQPADMDPILEVARRHRLLVVEDACQAHGARYRGRRVGTFGDIAAFSFYPGKNLGALGDAGMLTTPHGEVADKVRMMRNYGQRRKYEHAFLAWNRRLDTLQAAVLRLKLRRLDGWNAARRRVASLYDELLAGSGLELPYAAPDREHVYHLYVVQADGREKLRERLAAQGVATGVHYPLPIHLQEAYRDAGCGPGSFPVSEREAARVVSLPMFPELTEDQVRRVNAAARA